MTQAPLTLALLLFTLAQVATLAAAVLMFRSETKSLRQELNNVRAEVERARESDKELVEVKLNALTQALDRIERQVQDIARLVGGGQRTDDRTHTKE